MRKCLVFHQTEKKQSFRIMRAKKINQVRELLNGKEPQQQDGTPKFYTDGKGATYRGKHYASPNDLRAAHPRAVFIEFTNNANSPTD
jgi:hypothetical protein